MNYSGMLFGEVCGTRYPLNFTGEDVMALKKERDELKQQLREIHDTSKDLTILLDDIALQVRYDFESGEPMVRYCKDGSGHPGSADEIRNISVYYKGVEVTEIYSDRLDEIEEEIWKIIE